MINFGKDDKYSGPGCFEIVHVFILRRTEHHLK